MTPKQRQQLVEAAIAARQRAYAPYSQFQVGAALLTDDGEIFLGCNVENVSYGLTICAERVAVGTAVAAGRQSFQAIAIASSNGCTPCGACRQVLVEFRPDLPILLVNVESGGAVVKTSLAKLLPGQFDF
uniref:Cytidine deaminase n=1 Tax=Schlesneria paludicola TaxID=360056 RepID=A0A7C2K2R9_9PLAN